MVMARRAGRWPWWTTAWAICARWPMRCRWLRPATATRSCVTSDPDQVRAAERIVLPGQGAIADCMRELRDSGLLEPVLDAARNKPLFGVCVGMQMLLDHSEEGAGQGSGTPGLGLIPGRGRALRSGRAAATRWQPLQGATNGLEPGAPDAPGWRGPCVVGRAFRTRVTTISCTVTTPDRLMRATARARRTMAAALRRQLHAIIFSPPNSTPRRVLTKASRFTATSYAGSPDFPPSPAHHAAHSCD